MGFSLGDCVILLLRRGSFLPDDFQGLLQLVESACHFDQTVDTNARGN
jgi:hypothetical protein